MPNRNFNYSDETLTQYANDQLSYLKDDLADFVAFDPDLGEPKRAAMAELVNWALKEGGDDLNVSRLGNLTDNLLKEMDYAKRLYNEIRYWVMKAFPDQRAVQRQFGVGRYKRIAGSQEAMVVFFNSLIVSVEEYREALEAANTPGNLLDSVARQATALQEANNAQEKKKGNRVVDTEERINRLNALHKHTKDYNSAAEFVFYDFPAKRDRYRPPSKAASADEEEVDDDGHFE